MFLQGLTFEKLTNRLAFFQQQSDPLQRIKQIMQYTLLDEPKQNEKCDLCNQKLANDKKSITITCTHQFHSKCVLKNIIKQSFTCPICKVVHGKSQIKQPPGNFVKILIKTSCAGFEKFNTIQIEYEIPSGILDGVHYHGTTKKCYLPNNTQGQKVAELLEKGFKQGVIFTIGRSRQGQSNSVIFNDIHHKTSLKGGEFGYPDPTYLSRVESELLTLGIK